MSFQEILQIPGGLGVIASITFAGLQIRRSTITMRAAANHNINLTLVNMWMQLALSNDFMDLGLRGGEEFHSMTRVEKARVRMQIMAYMKIYENACLQHKLGILKDADWDAIVGDMRSGCSRPDIPHVWSLVSNRSGVEFRKFADTLFAETAASNAAEAERPAAT